MYNQNKLLLRCCENCKGTRCGEFKQVINLKNSGLLIYIHENEVKRKIWDDNRRSIILYNSGERELKRFDYIVELCRYKTKCLRCTALIQSVRSFLDEITTISKDEIIGICGYCKQANKRNKCKKCEYIVNKFVKNKIQECQDNERGCIKWFGKVQRMLLSIAQGEVICKHNISLDSESKVHLHNLIRNLKPPLPVTQPIIEVHPEMKCLGNAENNIIENKRIFDELISKLKADGNITVVRNDSFGDFTDEYESMCICKYLKIAKENDIPSPISETLSKQKLPNMLTPNGHEDKFVPYYKKKFLPLIKEKGKHITMPISKTEKKIDNKDNLRAKKNNIVKESKTFQDKNKNQPSGDDVLLKMIKEREKEKKLEKKIIKSEKVKKIPLIPDLPLIKPQEKTEVNSEDSDSVVECIHVRNNHMTKMIKGNVIVPYDFHNNNNRGVKRPLLFKIKTDFNTPVTKENQSFSDRSETIKVKHRNSRRNSSHPGNSGIILYQLSNPEFIKKGWTKLPSTKIMRRMNIYKMIPSCHEFDWFKNHKDKKILFYDTGEKLAEVFENVCGKWFYMNGDIALDCYYGKDTISGKRYTIYSSREDNTFLNKQKPITVLACFDYLGNGVVYDHFGKVRLKYNQSEGMVIDDKVAPPGRWKWHTLNDPPVLQQVFVNNQAKEDPCLNRSEIIKQTNDDMIAIELDNFLKEKAHKMVQNFKPFEIRIKTLKINNNFSLRIINQSCIYLMFRCGRIALKQNLGMLLKSDEIIDSNITELGDVSTPYDCVLPKSDSLNAIQNIILQAKKFI